MRVIEASQLLAADLFTAAEQTALGSPSATCSAAWPSWTAIPPTERVAAALWSRSRTFLTLNGASMSAKRLTIAP